ncbi:hypothetical protein AS9A_1468 [Hoyosella subflava DQS3-9A1]|uniref:Uncharacterized protein n=1 Tax=Hoyosella subflava (strain DSM 45089 / JCM 17490 / NBRC 109087 / DQS3-9A1) TaxID=443218 RepID=F6EH84_HOYSD|nr:hypothetical protein AS9A_1468 [Hoyosella subflava DQS3-9A1]
MAVRSVAAGPSAAGGHHHFRAVDQHCRRATAAAAIPATGPHCAEVGEVVDRLAPCAAGSVWRVAPARVACTPDLDVEDLPWLNVYGAADQPPEAALPSVIGVRCLPLPADRLDIHAALPLRHGIWLGTRIAVEDSDFQSCFLVGEENGRTLGGLGDR